MLSFKHEFVFKKNTSARPARVPEWEFKPAEHFKKYTQTFFYSQKFERLERYKKTWIWETCRNAWKKEDGFVDTFSV